MEINTEKDFYTTMDKLLARKAITQEEYDALTNYVCGIFDALYGCGFLNENDNW